MKENREDIRGLFARSGIELSDQQLDRFRVLLHRLVEKNPESDLTRLTTIEDIVVKHFVDSIMPGRLVELPSPLLDIGTGAGFPALPLMIMNPGLEMVLAEPRGRRISFLMEMIDELELAGAHVYPHKVLPDFPLEVAGVITRALESAAETLARCAPFLAPGGRVILMKGPAATDELAETAGEIEKYFTLSRDIPYAIPGTAYERRLLVFERTKGEWASRQPGKTGRSGRAVDIVSAANARFKELKSLLSGRGLKKEGTALFGGAKLTDEVVRDFPGDIVGWITPHNGAAPPRHFTGRRRGTGSPGRSSMSWTSTGRGGRSSCSGCPHLPGWVDSEKNMGLTLFVPFQDPANVGAVIRSAAAFGVGRVVLLEGAANPYHSKALRAAGTAPFRVPLMRGPAIERLRVAGVPLFTLTAEGENIARAVLPPNMGLLIGVEGPGVPQRFREKRTIGIPMEVGSESLNAATAAALAMYEWYRRHHTK